MATAQQQLDGFLKKYSPDVARLGRAAIVYMRNRLPGAQCLVYDNYNALAVGFGKEAKVSATPLSIALYPRWVTLFFLQGAGLEDPDRRLEGKGARVRSVRLASLDTLSEPAIDQLISAAVLAADWTLEPGAKGKLIIQSVSPNQRPRRP